MKIKAKALLCALLAASAAMTSCLGVPSEGGDTSHDTSSDAETVYQIAPPAADERYDTLDVFNLSGAALSEFSIVCPDGYDEYRRAVVDGFRSVLSRAAGAEIPMISPAQAESLDGKRIILAGCDMDETAAVLPQLGGGFDYVIDTSGADIILGGDNFWADSAAMTVFLRDIVGYIEDEDCFSENRVSIRPSHSRVYNYEPPASMIAFGITDDADGIEAYIERMKSLGFNTAVIDSGAFSDEGKLNDLLCRLVLCGIRAAADTLPDSLPDDIAIDAAAADLAAIAPDTDVSVVYGSFVSALSASDGEGTLLAGITLRSDGMTQQELTSQLRRYMLTALAMGADGVYLGFESVDAIMTDDAQSSSVAQITAEYSAAAQLISDGGYEFAGYDDGSIRVYTGEEVVVTRFENADGGTAYALINTAIERTPGEDSGSLRVEMPNTEIIEVVTGGRVFDIGKAWGVFSLYLFSGDTIFLHAKTREITPPDLPPVDSEQDQTPDAPLVGVEEI